MDTLRQPRRTITPRLGMTLAFTATAEPALADIPAQVIYIWPHLRSGAYLVTLQYADAVRLGQEFIHHIDAFSDELYEPSPMAHPGSLWPAQHTHSWLIQHVVALFRAVLSAIACAMSGKPITTSP